MVDNDRRAAYSINCQERITRKDHLMGDNDCLFCTASFDHDDALADHMDDVHPDES